MFQSTHSLRSATCDSASKIVGGKVSIHALLAECDRKALIKCALRRVVSIHALLAECDKALIKCALRRGVSIHALLAECDDHYRKNYFIK